MIFSLIAQATSLGSVPAPRSSQQHPNDYCPDGTPGPAPTQTQISSLTIALDLRQQAIAAARQGYYITALAFFRQLLSHSAVAMDYNSRGCIYLKLGQASAAIADFDRAITLDPEQSRTYLNRGNAVMMTGAYREALQNYSEALLLNPQDVRAWINRGVVLRNLTLYPLAIKSFDQALRLNALAGHIYGERGRTYELMGDWNHACGDYRRAIEALHQAPQTASVRQVLHQVKCWLAALIDQN